MTNNLGVSVGTDATVATDDVAGVHYQVVKLALGTEDSATRIGAGGGTEAAALRVTVATDSTGVLSVDDNGSTLSVDDGGGNLSIDDGGNLISIDDGGGTITVDGTVLAKGTIAHDSAVGDAPVVGGVAARAGIQTAVNAGDVAYSAGDLYGRSHVNLGVDPSSQVWKSFTFSTQQTGAALWTPASGKKIALTGMQISIGATTGGDVTVWVGASGDTTYTAGSDQLIGLYHIGTPAAGVKMSESPANGGNVSFAIPIYTNTVDYIIRLTTSAGITIDGVLYGYEFTP